MSKEQDALKTQMKKRAAEEATKYVKEGMILGIGSGSTVKEFIQLLKVKINPQKVFCIPSSYDTEELLIKNGFLIASLNQFPFIDLTIDGADRVDKDLNLIKGGGGALLQEKIIASAAKKVLILVDESKYVPSLEKTFPVPVEIIPLARAFVENKLKELGGVPALRQASDKLGPTITDNGNLILDTKFEKIPQPEQLEIAINAIPGVVANGLFSKKIVSEVLLAIKDEVKHLVKK